MKHPLYPEIVHPTNDKEVHAYNLPLGSVNGGSAVGKERKKRQVGFLHAYTTSRQRRKR